MDDKIGCGFFLGNHSLESSLPYVSVVEKRPEGLTGSNSYVPPHLRNQPKEPSHASKCQA